jgi:hypothetical protein
MDGEPILVTLNTAAQILAVMPYRIIHLCEKNCVTPSKDSQGQGTVRRFSRDDLFKLAVCLELQNAGATAARIEKAISIVDHLLHSTRVTRLNENRLCATVERLSFKGPVLLHVRMPDRNASTGENLPTLLQTRKLRMTQAPNDLGICPDSRVPDAWPVRITVNLTEVLKTIQLR